MFNFNPGLMQTDGGAETISSPITATLTRAQQQAAARKLAQGQPLTDQEKIFLGIPLSSEAANAPVNNATAEDSSAAAQAIADAKAAADKAAADKAAADAAAAAAKTAAEVAAAKAAQLAAEKALADAKAAADKAAADKAAQAKLLADEAKAKAQGERQSAYDLLYTEFDRYGLSSLVTPLKNLITSGASPAEFTIKLRESDAYQKRFSANKQRISKGLKAISEAEYIGLEDQYQNILRNAGLPESYWKQTVDPKTGIVSQEGFANFIGNDVSAVELEDRVSTAQKRLIYANP